MIASVLPWNEFVRRDHLVGAVQLELAVAARQLYGAFVGLGAAVADKDPVEAAMFDQQLRELYLRHGIELVGSLDQGFSLLLSVL